MSFNNKKHDDRFKAKQQKWYNTNWDYVNGICCRHPRCYFGRNRNYSRFNMKPTDALSYMLFSVVDVSYSSGQEEGSITCFYCPDEKHVRKGIRKVIKAFCPTIEKSIVDEVMNILEDNFFEVDYKSDVFKKVRQHMTNPNKQWPELLEAVTIFDTYRDNRTGCHFKFQQWENDLNIARKLNSFTSAHQHEYSEYVDDEQEERGGTTKQVIRKCADIMGAPELTVSH